MSSIEQQAVQTYQNNMNFLLHFHPELHKKMQTLDAAIETGQFLEKYDLEHINDYFDVKEKSTQNYLYGENSLALAQYVAKQVNFRKDEQVFETLYNFEFNDSAIELINQKRIQDSFYKGTAEIIHYTNNNTSKHDLMKEISKYIFLGVGLGLHLTEIDKKVNAAFYFIVEDDIELFKLSLFVTDYARLAINSTLYFAIAESGSAFSSNINSFISTAFVRNNYIKFFPFSNAYESKIKEIQSSIVAQPFRTYTYERFLSKTLISLNNMKENYNFLNISTPQNNTIFSKKPLLFLTPGPSLSKNIQWVKENHDKFIVVTVFAALKVLEKGSIAPDMVMHIDEYGWAVEKMRNQLSSLDFLKNAHFIFAASAPEELLSLFDKQSIYLIQDLTNYKQGFGALQGHSIGEIGYALTLLFGTHEIYLLGLDLALDPETGNTHSADHYAPVDTDMSNIDTAEEVASLRKTTLKIRGNFQEVVPTTALFYMSIHFVNVYTKTLKQPYQNVYNLSNGAFFNNIPALKAEKVNTSTLEKIDKTALFSSIQNYLDSHASNHLTQRDLEAIEARIKDALCIKDAIISHSKRNFPNYDIYKTAFSSLLEELIGRRTEGQVELAQIFKFYVESIAGNMTDLFNTKGLSNAKRHIKKLDKMLVVRLLEIIDVYLNILKEVKNR